MSTRPPIFLAFDFGAESGRAVVGKFQGGRMEIEELYRFPTRGISMGGRLQWDVTRMYGEMIEALRICAAKFGPDLDGIGVDTWGVDFALLGRNDVLLGNPLHYRGNHCEGAMEAAFTRMPRRGIYESTGIQFLPFNTAYQLFGLIQRDWPIRGCAEKLMLMGDYFSYLLSGKPSCEYSNATTTQLVDARTRTWFYPLIEALEIPVNLFKSDPVAPGTITGEIAAEICTHTGLTNGIPIIAPCTHDTASAIVAVPLSESHGNWAYLSSGTWSLLGAEVPEPVITERSYELNFTNEGGYGGKICLLKNIIGLWLIQECRRRFQKDGYDGTYTDLMAEAEAAQPFRTVIDPDDERLLAPADMPSTIRDIAAEADSEIPRSRGEIIRCALESLALKYARTLIELDELLGRKTDRLYVIGGGSQNALLCQMTADACGVDVIAGPAEATAIGNIVVQAITRGVISDLSEGRKTVARSFATQEYRAQNRGEWNAAEKRFEQSRRPRGAAR